MNKTSPKQKKTKPKQRQDKVFKDGFKFVGDFELQDSFGTFLILKNIDLSTKCPKYTQSTY